VDSYLRTNATDVFAVGDCAQLQNPEAGRKSVEAVWYTGKMMGETVAHNITGQQRPYQPGIWFNSAKFFQLEYQTYGQVSVNENSQEAHYHWIADGLHQALKFSYHPQTTALLGITNWGMRLRQDEIYQAIRHGLTLHQVIKTLDHYLFDAEFTPSKKANIELHFNQQASTTQHV
jgi:NADH dehydrogenase FAD-containing subunit